MPRHRLPYLSDQLLIRGAGNLAQTSADKSGVGVREFQLSLVVIFEQQLELTFEMFYPFSLAVKFLLDGLQLGLAIDTPGVLVCRLICRLRSVAGLARAGCR